MNLGLFYIHFEKFKRQLFFPSENYYNIHVQDKRKEEIVCEYYLLGMSSVH